MITTRRPRSLPILTLREIAMLQLMNQITDKRDWEHKVRVHERTPLFHD